MKNILILTLLVFLFPINVFADSKPLTLLAYGSGSTSVDLAIKYYHEKENIDKVELYFENELHETYKPNENYFFKLVEVNDIKTNSDYEVVAKFYVNGKVISEEVITAKTEYEEPKENKAPEVSARATGKLLRVNLNEEAKVTVEVATDKDFTDIIETKETDYFYHDRVIWLDLEPGNYFYRVKAFDGELYSKPYIDELKILD